MTTHGISNNDDGIVAGSPVVPMTDTRPGGGVATAPHPGFDVDRACRDTPGTRMVVHLNNAGAALPPVPVTDAVITHLRRESAIGGYEAAAAAADQVEHTYTAIARLIGCRVDEVAVVENATRAWDMAFYALNFAPGEGILTTRAEYASNVIAFLQVAARTGAVVEVIDNDETGQLSIADLRNRLNHGNGPVKLVAITHVPTQGGLVNPAEEVGAASREAGVPFLLDACQSVGQMPIDVEKIGCDMLSATGRKFSAVPGEPGSSTSAVPCSTDSTHPSSTCTRRPGPLPTRSSSAPTRDVSRTGKPTTPAKIGLGVAVDYALTWALEAIQARVTGLARRLRETLSNLDGVQVHDQGIRKCGIVSFTIDGIPAATVRQHLHDHGVNVSVSLVDHARLDLPHRGLPTLAQQAAYDRPSQMRIVKLIGPADPSAS